MNNLIMQHFQPLRQREHLGHLQNKGRACGQNHVWDFAVHKICISLADPVSQLAF